MAAKEISVKKYVVRLSGEEREQLEALIRKGKAPPSVKIFSVSFGMGVVSGIVMPFQFGTNWSRFSDITANIISPLLAYEGLTAFTLKAGFLGVLLFGRKL